MDKNDLISRSELLERLKENRPLNWGDTDEEIQAVEDFNFFTSVVKNAPAVDPEEMRPIGRWEYTSSACDLFCAVFRCSYCGAEDENGFCYNYCPNCGAYMRRDNSGKE